MAKYHIIIYKANRKRNINESWDIAMELAFSPERWDRIEREWTAFWAGEQKRPMVLMQSADRSIPESPRWHRFFPQYGKELSAEEILDIESAHLSRIRWFGDAFPSRMLDFGPGSLSTYMGASLEAGDDTVWFKATAPSLSEIKASIDIESPWRLRIQEILDCALRRWGKDVQLIPSDVGGGLDILAALRGAEELLLDFYDAPDEVLRLTQDITREWMANYDDEAAKIMSACRGCANWTPMFSKRRTYMLQCDFSYMISPALFEKYALPDIDALCKHLDDPFYHLDGKGQIPHLDAVLGIERLKGVQWIPGAGQPDASEWLDLLARIRKAGKLCQVYTSPEGALRIKNALGGTGFVFALGDCGGEEASTRIFAELTK